MSTFRNDPLLGIAKALLTFMMVIFVIAIVALGLGAAIMIAVKGAVISKLVENGASPDAFWAILLLLPLLAVMMMLSFRFAKTLRAIVRTVETGDPFIPDNADRLRQMAWLTLIMQIAAIPVGAIAAWIENATTQLGEVEIVSDISANGFILALVLFILARVFKTGAQMREDLEGTV
ncbi:MAG: hypothetical protein B7Y89_07275 [Novosphingobium sp. 32-60-15]|uniref:DUF2975 domain-containing protein n=1 Tax=unclassified Novosphingobium TaxID=2644732 RepID=UPI000BD5E0DC|nr:MULTISPECIES: DUF2975 domain-containing protein [unclassified Novosphingobium]OYX63005.1 MAG: hypothetical protein B7Y89_07275 [Novosphingobium sp. 32-60-15]